MRNFVDFKHKEGRPTEGGNSDATKKQSKQIAMKVDEIQLSTDRE